MGTDGNWLLGNPNACRDDFNPWNATWFTSLSSPEDMTRPWRDTPSSSGFVITVRFWIVQSRRDTEAVFKERKVQPMNKIGLKIMKE